MPAGDRCSNNTCNRLLTADDKSCRQCCKCRERNRRNKEASRSHQKRKVLEGDVAVDENTDPTKRPKLSNSNPPEVGAGRRRAPLKAMENQAGGHNVSGDEVGTCGFPCFSSYATLLSCSHCPKLGKLLIQKPPVHQQVPRALNLQRYNTCMRLCLEYSLICLFSIIQAYLACLMI